MEVPAVEGSAERIHRGGVRVFLRPKQRALAAQRERRRIVTEMDALVAYLQMLGTLVKFRDVDPADLRQ